MTEKQTVFVLAGNSIKRRVEQWIYHQKGLRKKISVIGKSLNEVKEIMDKPKKKKG